MDIEGLEFGGTRQFFTGEYEKYAWTEIMKPETAGSKGLFSMRKALKNGYEPQPSAAVPGYFPWSIYPLSGPGYLEYVPQRSQRLLV